MVQFKNNYVAPKGVNTKQVRSSVRAWIRPQLLIKNHGLDFLKSLFMYED